MEMMSDNGSGALRLLKSIELSFPYPVYIVNIIKLINAEKYLYLMNNILSTSLRNFRFHSTHADL